MARYKDLTGQRFGKLVALNHIGSDKFHNALWECVCDCGNKTVANAKSLTHGDKRSCGCLHAHNLEGQRFGRLVVLELVGTDKRRNRVWKCKCDCGNIVNVQGSYLTSHHHTQSCGCLMRETTSKTMTTHGKTGTRLYMVWKGMNARCRNPNHITYHNYGGRGIKVCDEWLDFSVFEKWALENGYDETAKRGKCTIDRIDVNGDYEPSNCRWVDQKTQMNNCRPRKRKNSFLRGKEETK